MTFLNILHPKGILNDSPFGVDNVYKPNYVTTKDGGLRGHFIRFPVKLKAKERKKEKPKANQVKGFQLTL